MASRLREAIEFKDTISVVTGGMVGGQQSCSVPLWNDSCTKDVNCTAYMEVEKSVLSENEA